MTTRKYSQNEAYNLKDSSSHIKYYDSWAKTYDIDFAKHNSYIYPEKIAKLFLKKANKEDTPILDIGCGTGLVGQGLKSQNLIVDGLDISSGMLIEAKKKQVYRHLILQNLNEWNNELLGTYGALISAGTFTVGHLGCKELFISLSFAQTGAFCVIGINKAHFEAKGFSNLFQRLQSQHIITPVKHLTVPIYGKVDHHESDVNQAHFVVFRLTNELKSMAYWDKLGL